MNRNRPSPRDGVIYCCGRSLCTRAHWDADIASRCQYKAPHLKGNWYEIKSWLETRNELIIADRRNGLTLDAIGSRYRLSKERVRQICAKAQRKMERDPYVRLSLESIANA